MGMPRAGSRTITVDGDKYRWRISGRAITVEHADRPRGVVREDLSSQEARDGEQGVPEPSGPAREAITPARVAQLIRHARSRGWRPTEDTGVFEVPTVSVWDDPRGRDYYQWARLLRQELGQLEKYLGCAVELGALWWHGSLSDSSGGLGARIRFDRFEVMPEPDFWEAAFCISGNRGERAYTDIFAFPFRDGINLGLEDEKHWIFSLQPEPGQIFGSWQPMGWVYWAGPGEWSYASEPGCIFYHFEPVTAHVRAATVPATGTAQADSTSDGTSRSSMPIKITAELDETFVGRRDYWCSLHRVEEAERGSIVDMSGSGKWLAWAECQPIAVRESEDAVFVDIDVSRLSIAGGWTPGSYRLSLRLRAVDSEREGHSVLIAPISVTIAP